MFDCSIPLSDPIVVVACPSGAFVPPFDWFFEDCRSASMFSLAADPSVR